MEYQQTAAWNRPFLTRKTRSPQSSLSSNELQQMVQWESHYESKNLPLVNSAQSSYNYTPFGSNNVSPLGSMGSNGSEFKPNQLAGCKISGLENGPRTRTYDNSINFTSGSSDQSEGHSFNSDVSVEFLDNSRESGSSKSSGSSQAAIEVLSRMRHPHMVILLGACPENGCLVYEYMENGSLEDRLYRKNDTPPLSWRARFRIAAEIAIALNFLHQTRPEPLVHRDLKPANILLDNHYVSKISDVGLARLVPPPTSDTITQYHMTSAAGTFCYIDPEYQQTGMLGTKSDIYSLGILLLQIITAKPPMGLTHKVENAIETGTFDKILDPTVKDWPIEEALSFAELALKCCELRRRDRPALDSVILPELERLRDLGSDMEGIFTHK